MKQRVVSTLLVAGAIGLATSNSALAADTPAAAAAEAAAPALEEVTVSARKFREDLQRTGAAVAAFSASDLERMNVAVSTDLQSFVPNLVFKRRGNSGAFGQVIKIRGIGVSDLDVPTSDPSVAVYVDGVFQAKAFGPQYELFDVEDIEVLRGPQGTLYGKNALGGAINIVTRKPAAGDSLDLSATFGNFGRQNFSGSMPMTLVDGRLYGRLSVVSRSSDGRVRNNYNTEQKLGDENFVGSRYALRYDGDQGTTVDVTLDASRQSQTPAPYYVVGLSTAPTMLINVASARAGYTPSASLVPLNPSWSDLNHISTDTGAGFIGLLPPGRGANGHAADDATFYGASVALQHNFANGMTLRSITGYRHFKRLLSQDIDGTPVDLIDQVYHDSGSQLTQEFQLNSSMFDDRLQLVGGLFYMHQKSNTDQTNPFFLGLLQATGLNITALRLTDLSSDAYAGYVHGMFAVTDRLKLSAGLRYGDERKSAHIKGGPLTQPNPPYAFDGSRSQSWRSPQPKFGVDYSLTNNVFGYASVSKGYASGGFNGRVTISTRNFINTFDEESLWSYELGLKSWLFNRRARLNVAAFYMAYDNVVVQSFAPGGNGQPIGFFLANAGRAQVQGAEAEFQVQATDTLSLRANLGIIEQKFKDFGFDASGNKIDPSQAHFFDSPKTTSSVVLNYDRPIGTAGARIQLAADWSYQSRVYFDNSGLSVGSQAPYSQYNASATYQLPGDHLSVSLWGKNLSDKLVVVRSANFMSAPIGFAVALFNEPRTIGLTLRYRD